MDMIDQAMRATGVDADLLPFGRMKKETLLKAKMILKELACVLGHFFVSASFRTQQNQL